MDVGRNSTPRRLREDLRRIRGDTERTATLVLTNQGTARFTWFHASWQSCIDLCPPPRPLDRCCLGVPGGASLEHEPAEVVVKAMREAERHDPERVKRRVVLVVDAETQLNLVEAGAAAYGVDVTVVLDINHLVEYVWRRRMYSMTRAAATVAGLSRRHAQPGRHVHGLPAGAGRRPPVVDAGHGLARALRGDPVRHGRAVRRDLGYGMAGPGGRGTGTPYAGLTPSGMGYWATRYGWRWEVGQQFNLGVEGSRHGSFGGFAQPVLGDAGDRLGGAQHSVQVDGGVSF